jgi:hypothetical protein
MGLPLPDYVFDFMGHHWGELGFVPAWIWRLIYDMGYTPEEVDEALTEIIGADFADIPGREWIDRMIAKGSKDMAHSLEFDEPPVLDIVDSAMRHYLETHKQCRGMCNACEKCEGCKSKS